MLILPGGCKIEPKLETIYRDATQKLNTGDLPGALTLAEQGRRSSQKDLVWNWKFRLVQADVKLWQGHSDESLAIVKSLPQEGILPVEISIQAHLALGRALYNLYHSDAEAELAKAEQLATAGMPEMLGEVALAWGGFHYNFEQFDAAKKDFENALQLAVKYKQQLLEAKAQGSLGRWFTHQGLYDKSRDQAAMASIICRSIHARHVEVINLLNQGWNAVELGDFEQAIPIFARMQELAASAGMEKAVETALNNLGRIHLNQEDYEKATAEFSSVLAMARKRADKPNIALYLDNLALSALGLHKLEDAERYNQEALSILENKNDHVEKIVSLLINATIANAQREFAKAVPLLKSIIRDKETPASIRWEAEDQLAASYEASGNNGLGASQYQKVLNALDQAQETIVDYQSKLAFSFWVARFSTDYIRLLIKMKKPEDALRVAESMRARTLRRGLRSGPKSEGRLQVKHVQKFLASSNRTIMSYWLASEKSYLWVISPSEFRLFILPAKNEIEKNVEKYQAAVTNLSDVESGDENGQALYRTLIEPAEELIHKGTKIIVIPDGDLDKLSFETLLTSRTHHFWIRDFELQSASSIELLLKSKPSYVNLSTKKVLVIGDPIQADPEYSTLEHAREEIDQIKAILPAGSVTVISGADAVPSAYERSTPSQYEVIHFSTHGSANETNPLESAIILSLEGDNRFKLYAEQVVKIRITAQVVVISACYGAGKRAYSAEGLVGLAWAFLRAGAHQVIAGIWDVDDEATPRLMNNFYVELKKSGNASAALRSAKLSMLNDPADKKHHRPYYWAALQLYNGS